MRVVLAVLGVQGGAGMAGGLCPTDLDGSGVTDAPDLNVVLAQFGQVGPGLVGDLDGDGSVGSSDLNVVLGAFSLPCEGACCIGGGCMPALGPDDCLTAGGSFVSGEACEAVDCASAGACCLASGCMTLAADACLAAGGLHLGPAASCALSPCGQVCCFGDDCQALAPDLCLTSGGLPVPLDSCAGIVCEAAAGCAEGAGDCCTANGTPGCDDYECCVLIGAFDAFCCCLSWDAICADVAQSMCEGVCPGSCCEARLTPGCNSAACEQQVCADDPWCCEGAWDEGCVALAAELCPSCMPDPGACCLGAGGCQEVLEVECFSLGGSYLGDGTECFDKGAACQGAGACCDPDGSCLVLFEADCVAAGGAYAGDGVTCQGACSP